MATMSLQNPWLRRAYTFVKRGLAMLFCVAVVLACVKLMLVVEAFLNWDSANLRDRRDFGEERTLESRINRVIQDETLRVGQSIILSDIVVQPMRQACMQGRYVPNHVRLDGPTIKLMRKSYRPERNTPTGDLYGELLAVEFSDGRVLGFQVLLSPQRLSPRLISTLAPQAAGLCSPG
jgi:hypothetical protein